MVFADKLEWKLRNSLLVPMLFKERKFFYISLKKLRVYGILAFFFRAHSFMNRFCKKFLWMLTLWRRKFFKKSSMTSKVNKGHKQWPFDLKIKKLFLLFMLLIDWRNECRWTLWKNKVWLIQRRHFPCFILTSTWLLSQNRISKSSSFVFGKI